MNNEKEFLYDNTNLDKFIKLDEKFVEEYDFSCEQAKKEYGDLRAFKRFITYMEKRKKGSFSKKEKYDLFINASYKILGTTDDTENLRQYGKIIDPDSESVLLQKIYLLLWNNNSFKKCMKIQGETLNSTNTTLNKFYEYIEKKLKIDGNIERENMPTNKGTPQPISIKYIISKYVDSKYNCKESSAVIEYIKENKIFNDFINTYHTLGNFMPIPKGCNQPRGFNNHYIEDYWDLTLLYIYKYYKGDNQIELIVGKEFKDIYKEWLDSFNKDNDGWNNFIKENYLQDFIDEEKNHPKELWEGHFKGSVLPENINQCISYFKTATELIQARSKRILKALKDSNK